MITFAETFEDATGLIVYVHEEEHCELPCPVHGASTHHMRDWPLVWRGSLGYFERVCGHGVGHPDPDSLDYRQRHDLPADGTHGCCGCCTARKPAQAVLTD